MASPDSLKADLLRGAAELSLALDEPQAEKMLAYLTLLQRWNRAYNLTAIREPAAMLTGHLLDSLSVAPHLTGEIFADIGTGPGLPGIPLAILFPDKRFLLLDSNGKKTRFLFQAITTLELSNVEAVHARVESYQPGQLFDGVISRAFTALADMVEKTAHLLADGGYFYAMKGTYPKEELSALPKGFKVEHLIPLQVPGLVGERHLVQIATAE